MSSSVPCAPYTGACGWENPPPPATTAELTVSPRPGPLARTGEGLDVAVHLALLGVILGIALAAAAYHARRHSRAAAST